MNIRHLALLITLLCAATARAAPCQSPVSTVHEGDRIRVQRYDARHPRIGKLVAHSADSLTVE